MPSSTFFNLAPEKQEKLLSAAVAEFTQRPYNEASINRIVREAEISRGSFYMYFQDKEELFRYLMQESIEEVLDIFQKILESTGGDVFEAVLQLHDYLVSHRQGDSSLGGLGMMFAVVNRNCGLQRSGLLEFLDPKLILERVSGSVNPDLLDLREEDDLDNMLGMMLILLIPVMYHCLQPDAGAPERRKLVSILQILRRGMGAKPASAQQ